MEKLNHLVLTHRRLIIAICAGIAAWAVVSALSFTPESTLVPVAARDLDSGAPVSAADVKLVEFALDSAPDRLLSKSEITARIVAGPMRKGEPFTDQRAISPNRLASGEQLALIEMSASTAQLLRVGDLVEVVALDADDPDQNRTIAKSVSIASLDARGDSATTSIGVAVEAGVAHEIMSAQLQSPLVVLPVGFP